MSARCPNLWCSLTCTSSHARVLSGALLGHLWHFDNSSAANAPKAKQRCPCSPTWGPPLVHIAAWHPPSNLCQWGNCDSQTSHGLAPPELWWASMEPSGTEAAPAPAPGWLCWLLNAA